MTTTTVHLSGTHLYTSKTYEFNRYANAEARRSLLKYSLWVVVSIQKALKRRKVTMENVFKVQHRPLQWPNCNLQYIRATPTCPPF